MGARVHIVHIDELGARVAPRPGDPVTEAAIVELVKFLGRAALAAGRAVGHPEPVVRLVWRWGQVDVKPSGPTGFIGVVMLDAPEAPPSGGGEAAHATA